ncbi:MAG: oligosaccharide flippase family protein [Solirubrobacteraceae bacterium]
MPGNRDAAAADLVGQNAGAGFAGDVSVTFLAKAATYGLGFASTVIVARSLGPTGRGTVAVALTLAAILVQLGSAGLISGCAYYVAGEKSSPAQAARQALLLSIAIGGVLAIGVIALRAGALDVVGIGWVAMVLVAAGAPGMLYMLLLQGILLGAGRARAYNALDLYRASSAVAGLLIWETFVGLDQHSAIAILIGAWWLAAAMGLVHLRAPKWWRPELQRELLGEMLRYGARVYVGTVLGLLLITLDLLLVKVYLGARAAGLYSVTATMAEAMLLIPLVVGINLLPRVARGSGPAASAAAFRSTAIVLGAACAVCAAFAEPLVRLLFGDSFAPAASLFQLLTPGVFALGLAAVLSHHFAGEGYPLPAVAAAGVALALNIALDVALLRPLGLREASLASSAAYMVFLALQSRLFVTQVGGYRALIPRWGDVRALARLAHLPG